MELERKPHHGPKRKICTMENVSISSNRLYTSCRANLSLSPACVFLLLFLNLSHYVYNLSFLQYSTTLELPNVTPLSEKDPSINPAPRYTAWMETSPVCCDASCTNVSVIPIPFCRYKNQWTRAARTNTSLVSLKYAKTDFCVLQIMGAAPKLEVDVVHQGHR